MFTDWVTNDLVTTCHSYTTNSKRVEKHPIKVQAKAWTAKGPGTRTANHCAWALQRSPLSLWSLLSLPWFDDVCRFRPAPVLMAPHVPRPGINWLTSRKHLKWRPQKSEAAQNVENLLVGKCSKFHVWFWFHSRPLCFSQLERAKSHSNPDAVANQTLQLCKRFLFGPSLPTSNIIKTTWLPSWLFSPGFVHLGTHRTKTRKVCSRLMKGLIPGYFSR